MVEQEIARVVGEWRAGISVFPTTSTEPSIVAEIEHNLAQNLAERKEKACAFCEEQPCVWLSNHNSMRAWDE
jgi:predicted RNA-binding Zn ribbon-like protein